MVCPVCGNEIPPSATQCVICGGRTEAPQASDLRGRLFVGREAELARLGGALADAIDGRGRLVLLAGEPGIGKTRTAEEVVNEAERRGASALWSRCDEDEGAPAFWMWVQLLRAIILL